MNTNDKYLIISLLEGFYIYYMLNIFKTKYNFDHIWIGIHSFAYSKLGKFINSKTNNYFFHSYEHSKIQKSHVCPFGKDVSIMYVLWLLLRNCSKLIKDKNKYIIFIASIMLLLNFNILVYMLPILVIEYYLYKTNI